jgi:hypothetical protein
MSFEAKRSWYAKCKKCKTNWRGTLATDGYKTEAAFRKYENSMPNSFTGDGGKCDACAVHGISPPGSLLTTWSNGKPQGAVRDMKPVKSKSLPQGGATERLQQQETKPSDFSPKPAAAPPCCINLTLNVFFDGTGNNMKTDEATQETSNVVRLFLAHQDNDDKTSTYALYIPGLGTLFPEVGDPGGTPLGLGVGYGGQDRLDYTIKKLDERVAAIPADKLKSVRLSVFGFSRGAALARALAAQLHTKRCELVNGQWKFKTKAGKLVDFEVYFMGLFDCVASSGLPASARKYASDVVKYGAPVMPVLGPLGILIPIAAKKAAQASGHGGWAADMVVHPTVKSVVHYYSVHETRNSFPLDSLRVGNSLPAGIQMEEKAYYGVHSNVGGGYRPGENGRSMLTNMQLSNVPLNWMYEKAKANGVALYGFKDMVQKVKDTFSIAGGLQQAVDQYASLHRSAEQAPHELMYNHMRPYIRWRSYRFSRGIAKFNADTSKDIEDQSRKEHADYDRQIEAIDKKVKAIKAEANRKVLLINDELMRNSMTRSREGFERNKRLINERAQINSQRDAECDVLEAQRLEIKNKIGTLPTHDMPKDGKPVASQSKYFKRWETKQKELKAQIDLLKINKKDGMPLIKYHDMLIEAWDQSLDSAKDEAIYSFFDNFVHDSASDFDSDRSLLIDPRMVFIGGDTVALDPEYASVSKKRAAWEKEKALKERRAAMQSQIADPANQREVQEILKEANQRFGKTEAREVEWGD